MNIKKIRPLYSAVVTTARKYCVDEVGSSGLIDTSKLAGALKEFQTVVAVGEFVKNIKVGDLVRISPDDYAVKQFRENSIKNNIMENQVVRYNFNTVELDGIQHLILKDRDVLYVVEEYDDTDENKVIDATPSLLV